MGSEWQIPMAFPRKHEIPQEGMIILAGDVGGTKTNLAFYKATKDSVELLVESTYHSSKFPSCIDVVKQFVADFPGHHADRICLGVAGPVLHGKVEITNLNWNLDGEVLRTAIGVKEVSLINDLEATAYGLAGLNENDFITVHAGKGSYSGNIGIVAPGTGLGEAGMYWDGAAYHPFPTEGGHTDFSPRTELDIELYWFLQKKYGIASWEKVIAGPGIHDIFLFLVEKRKYHVPEWLQSALDSQDPSAVISEAALDEKNPVCEETMQIFVRLLARECSNLVLKMKTTGGLYLAGGIPPKIAPLLQQNVFYDNFLDCDRMQHLVEKVPLRIVLNAKAALIGAAYYGAYGALAI